MKMQGSHLHAPRAHGGHGAQWGSSSPSHLGCTLSQALQQNRTKVDASIHIPVSTSFSFGGLRGFLRDNKVLNHLLTVTHVQHFCPEHHVTIRTTRTLNVVNVILMNFLSLLKTDIYPQIQKYKVKAIIYSKHFITYPCHSLKIIWNYI